MGFLKRLFGKKTYQPLDIGPSNAHYTLNSIHGVNLTVSKKRQSVILVFVYKYNSSSQSIDLMDDSRITNEVQNFVYAKNMQESIMTNGDNLLNEWKWMDVGLSNVNVYSHAKALENLEEYANKFLTFIGKSNILSGYNFMVECYINGRLDVTMTSKPIGGIDQEEEEEEEDDEDSDSGLYYKD